MMGSFLTRGLVMVLGYTYPAYECFKIVEKNKPEIEQLRFWCQYWILVAVLTVLERVGDTFISWVPMYSEAKLAFFVYLWYPKTRGTAYVYDSFLKPYVSKHETEIDRNLMELRAKAGDIAVLYWQKAASYGHTRIFEIMQYAAASQSPRPHAAQQQNTGVRRPPPAAPAQPPPPKQPQPAQQPPSPKQPQPAQQPPSPKQPQPAQQPLSPKQPQPASPKQPQPAQPPPRSKQPQRPPATAAVGQQDKPGQETRATIAPQTAAAPTPAQTQAQTTVPAPVTTEAPSQSTVSSEGQLTETKPVLVPLNEGADPPPQEIVMEEAIRMTRGRLRKTRAASSR
eukprot:TRINITY_DN1019_c0_g2_i1.p1 TRINITY_DN1019_c0_g2~~TRINITY_DN1019_c0_g2_i1.p1  ORF type:complete len:339 (+),score=74.84 TRINITY_DN1019_c0_g2_i1:173-1189(+)